jgi:hypothetical protein
MLQRECPGPHGDRKKLLRVPHLSPRDRWGFDLRFACSVEHLIGNAFEHCFV